jgi:hypothetical protein
MVADEDAKLCSRLLAALAATRPARPGARIRPPPGSLRSSIIALVVIDERLFFSCCHLAGPQ